MAFTEQQVPLRNKNRMQLNNILHKQVFQLWSGYLFAFILFSGCNRHKENIFPAAEVRLAKTLPGVYKNATDTLFSTQQDTVFYAEKYYTGYQYAIFANADTATMNGYFNGVQEGIQRKWYSKDLLSEERLYINGKKEGIQKGWWPNEKPKFYYTAYNNEYNGEFIEWYSTGLLAKKFHYLNGQEEGSQRLWWDNQTVRANYVIKNGKKYGLIGLKICVNPYDSIAK